MVAPPKPPNILVIVTDDERVDEQSIMTQTNALFQKGGVTFTNAYAETPLCCPSRASIFTGQYTHNHGVHANSVEEVAHLDLRHTVQAALHQSGYRTGIVGKIFNGWDLTKPPPDFDRHAIMQAGYANTNFLVDGVPQVVPQYSTDFVSDQAVSMLGQFEQDAKHPWFLYVAPFAPHWPYTPAAQDVAADVGTLSTSAALSETDLADKPPWIANRKAVDLGRTPAQVWQDQRRSLLAVDRMVKRLFDTMKHPRDTLAIFISDNGYMLGEHNVTEDKRLPYPESVKVPMTMRWPAQLAGGRKDSRPVLNVDIAATILDAANVDGRDLKMDGYSLLGRHKRAQVFLESYPAKEFPNDPEIPAWTSVITSDTQYTEWRGPAGLVVFRELYDRTKDPNQLDNLFVVDPPAAEARAVPLAESLTQLRTCAGTRTLTACP